MDSQERRESIIEILKEEKAPIKGTDLSEKFQVSRQVIVQDIALLRARGENILATPNGYIIPSTYESDKLIKKIVSIHEGYKEMEDELELIVDMGGKVLDVIVDHPLYGEIKSPIEISNRHEVMKFMENIKRKNAEPLSSLTGGIHIHTLEVNDEESFKRIKEELGRKKYLIND